MRFAFAGIDFLGDVFATLIDCAWQPVKLFSRPCDQIYDFNDVTVAKAQALGIPVQMTRLLPADLTALKVMGCDALIVAGYPWLIPDWTRDLPYAINFHPSPLPEGRGPYPLFQAILDRWPEWGITAHLIDAQFDTGAILDQRRFPIAPDATHDQLLARCQIAAKDIARAMADDLPRLWVASIPQIHGSYWPRLTSTQRTVNWSGSVADVLRTIRAFGSIESFALVESHMLHVWSASGWIEAHRFRSGSLIHRDRCHLVVAAADGFVQLTGWSLSPPGDARKAKG